ncbi:ABC transporter permease [Clostridium beijerinckii]|uniref:ABC transporter permease subunit n=1 Tax=Clostridium beijerinckii TaxID=1520 RepID=A0A7X9XN12_CLOBE|nr:ABC transporter permease [Clostridium beijerinckii]NMF03695.1 ABC transporter permease subunit [Clostridium beijerinckii]
MYNLLIAECMKIKKNVVLKMLIIGICAISVALSINNIYNIKVCYTDLSQMESYSGASQFCAALAMGHNFLNITIPLTVFGGIYICYDFERKLCQSSVYAGCKKFDIFFSKMIIYFIISAVLLLIYSGISTLIPSIVFSDYIKYNNSMILQMIRIYFVSIIYHFARVSPIILAAYFMKKTGPTVILWGIIYIAVDKFWQGITELFPGGIVDKVYDNTIWQINKCITTDMAYLSVFRVVGVSLIYIIVFVGIAYILFKREEIK